jgi:peptidase E
MSKSMVRQILATSGGFLPRENSGGARPGGLIKRALELTGLERPRVLLIMTATGDDPGYLSLMYSALRELDCVVDHLALFPMPNHDPEEILSCSDVIWVGGGSVVNLLAIWKAHNLDSLLRQAWNNGTVLAGVSAGSICWHVAGPTDSYGKTLQPALDGLGLLPYGNGVHYDSEKQRRPLVHELVGSGVLPTTYATDDRIGILYQDTTPIEVVTDLDWVEPDGPAAYRIELRDGVVVETRLPVGPIIDLPG